MNPTTIDKLARQERTRREILNKSDLIPSLPDLVLRVIDLLNRTDTEPEELERHIRYDQVLVAKLLSLVNSPFYAVKRKITTISDAIMVLGFRSLRSLVLASSTAQFMARDFSVYGHTEKGLWVHALATATAARTLAKELRLGMAAAEEMFVAGLLHDVGKMLVVPYLVEANLPRFAPTDDICDIERNTLGLDHTEAGALVCAKWNLSEALQDIVKHHHGTDDSDSTSTSKSLALVRVAHAFARELGHGYEPEFRTKDYRVEDLVTLELDTARWQQARERIEHDVASALASLQDICS